MIDMTSSNNASEIDMVRMFVLASGKNRPCNSHLWEINSKQTPQLPKSGSLDDNLWISVKVCDRQRLIQIDGLVREELIP